MGEGEEEEEEEDKEQARKEVTESLRALVQHVCTLRFGAVPEAVAEALAQEGDLGLLARWYIASGTCSADELSAMVRAPRPA
jgi:hypothetical protein